MVAAEVRDGATRDGSPRNQAAARGQAIGSHGGGSHRPPCCSPRGAKVVGHDQRAGGVALLGVRFGVVPSWRHGLLEEGHHSDEPRRRRRACRRATADGRNDPGRRKAATNALELKRRQRQRPKAVAAHRSPGRLSHPIDRGQQQGRQDGQDADDDEQFDERKPTMRGWLVESSRGLANCPLSRSHGTPCRVRKFTSPRCTCWRARRP